MASSYDSVEFIENPEVDSSSDPEVDPDQIHDPSGTMVVRVAPKQELRKFWRESWSVRCGRWSVEFKINSKKDRFEKKEIFKLKNDSFLL
jgi:hypothetical protein